MFKNLVKKVKSFAKKAAPYAGLALGAFGMNPGMAAGLGALIGGIGGGTKGAVAGGLGGYFGGKAFGASNPLFNAKGLFGPEKFINQGVFEGMGSRLIGEGGNIFDTAQKLDKAGNPIKKGMMDYLPLVGLGTGAAYAAGLFDEPPLPDDAIPKEYKYDPDNDPLKGINQKFYDLYGSMPSSQADSIYSYLQSIGAMRNGGGVMAFADGGRDRHPEKRLKTDLEILFEKMNPNLPDDLSEYEFGESYKDPETGEMKTTLIKKTEETFADGKGTNPPMEQMIVPNPNLPSAQGIMQESGILSLEELEIYIDQLTMLRDSGELTPEQFQQAVQMVMEKAGQTKAAQNGGIAQFNYGGEIMGPGTGREDIIPGKIVDRNTGQTSDMLVSNNEHIIPEYTLYAMGGGDTEKGHEMMNKLRSETKTIADKMGYDFKGAENGSVRYG
jgi:hypothetical protein